MGTPHSTSAYDHLLKILLIGDAGSNKRVLLRKYIGDTEMSDTTTLGKHTSLIPRSSTASFPGHSNPPSIASFPGHLQPHSQTVYNLITQSSIHKLIPRSSHNLIPRSSHSLIPRSSTTISTLKLGDMFRELALLTAVYGGVAVTCLNS